MVKKVDEAKNEATTLKLQIQEANSNLSKFHNDLECKLAGNLTCSLEGFLSIMFNFFPEASSYASLL